MPFTIFRLHWHGCRLTGTTALKKNLKRTGRLWERVKNGWTLRSIARIRAFGKDMVAFCSGELVQKRKRINQSLENMVSFSIIAGRDIGGTPGVHVIKILRVLGNAERLLLYSVLSSVKGEPCPVDSL